MVVRELIKLGVPARLVPPSSYRSTSAFEAIRANLAVPLRMALKMRSKLGCQASNLLCSAMLNNAIIEGTWIFGGWRLCPSGRLRAHRSVQIQFFRPSKKQHTVGKGVIQNSSGRNSRRYAVFFVLIFLLLDGMLKWLLARTAGKKHRAVRAPSKKKAKNEVKKTNFLKNLLSGICFGAGLSQCTFGHSQIRLQTSGHESLLAQIAENWITFGNSLKIESKNSSFC